MAPTCAILAVLEGVIFQKLFLRRARVVQVLIGLSVALFGSLLQEWTWGWIEYHHLILQIPFVLLAVFLGQSFLSGIASMALSVALWLLYFHQPLEWLDLIAFSWSGMGVAFLGSRKLPEFIARKQELERLHYAALAARVGIWEWDIVHDRVFWDEQMFRFYGLTKMAAQVNSKIWLQGVHPEDREQAKREVESAVHGGKEFNTTFRVLHPDGTVRRIHASALVRRDLTGKPLAMYGMNRDVTEEVSNLEKLKQVNAYFQAAMDQSPLGVVIAEAPSGRLQFCNRSALAIRGGDRSDLVDSVHLHYYDPWQILDMNGNLIPSEETPLSRSLVYGEVIRKEVGIRHQDGQVRIVLTNTSPIRREDGSILAAIAIFIDNTENHILLEQLEKSKKTAEQAANVKARFLDIAAHELRTPVTAFSLLIQMTQKRLQAGVPVQGSDLERLRAQADRLSRLVVDLLEVSRLDRGMLLLKREKHDLGHLVQEAVQNFRLQYPDRRFLLSGNGRKVEAEVDAVRIYEVVSNLIDNALKYTKNGELIEIIFLEKAESVVVSVKDRGPGISEARQHLLFKPFERGDTRELEYSGLGLGLYICRKIIELHGGTISVQSQLGHGSIFSFEIPKYAAEITDSIEVA